MLVLDCTVHLERTGQAADFLELCRWDILVQGTFDKEGVKRILSSPGLTKAYSAVLAHIRRLSIAHITPTLEELVVALLGLSIAPDTGVTY